MSLTKEKRKKKTKFTYWDFLAFSTGMVRMMDELEVRVWGGWERGESFVFEKERMSEMVEEKKR